MKRLCIGLLSLPRVRDTGDRTRLLYEGFGFSVTAVGRRRIEQGDLDGFDLLHCPGGHSVTLAPRGVSNLRRYVRGGGGFVGVCAGAHYIAEIGLLPLRLAIVRASGIYHVRVVARHPVTRGFARVPRSPERRGCNPVPHSSRGRVRLDRGNGAFMLAGRGVEILATYDNDDRYAAIVAGRYGAGRVVAFSCHPQTESSFKAQRTDPRAPLLLRNAALFCAKGDRHGR